MKFVYLILLLPLLTFSQGLVIGDTVSLNVVYRNIKDTSVQYSSAPVSVDIDLDIDNTHDISFIGYKFFAHGLQGEKKYVKALTNLEFAYGADSLYADTLSLGSLINNGLNWQSGDITLHYWTVILPPPWPPVYQELGQFKAGSLYLGIRKIFSTDTVYGWFNLQMPGYIIKSFAYEKKCNVISCVGINELFQSEIRIFPNPACEKIHIITENNNLKNAKIKLTNEIGQTLLSSDFRDVIDVSSLPSGLYFLQIQTSEGLLNKKIIIQR